jgi:WhiB family redox-sensing transcriptional regulator
MTLDGIADLDLDWQDAALCAQADPEAWYPEKGGSTKEAKQICRACPVRMECLQYALDREDWFGIWGGLSERQRRRLHRAGTTAADFLELERPVERKRTRGTPTAAPAAAETASEPPVRTAPVLRRSYGTPWPPPGDPLLDNPIVGNRPAA